MLKGAVIHEEQRTRLGKHVQMTTTARRKKRDIKTVVLYIFVFAPPFSPPLPTFSAFFGRSGERCAEALKTTTLLCFAAKGACARVARMGETKKKEKEKKKSRDLMVCDINLRHLGLQSGLFMKGVCVYV